MRRTTLLTCISLVSIAFGALMFLRVPLTNAGQRRYSNSCLWGTYASQLTGTMVFPSTSPMAFLNGPYCLTGTVDLDGQGNAQGTVYENYNGLLLNYSWTGTYQVNVDGTVKLSANINLFGQAFPLVMFGVICDGGKQVRLTAIGPAMSGSMIPGVPNLGFVITGSWILQ